MGHATRCVPIINALLSANFEPIIASDGDALKLLEKEFPALKHYALPGYNINYSKRGNLLKFKLLSQLPAILSTIRKEKRIVEQIIKAENISGIISDNRFGAYSCEVPSVYTTHQLNVLSGSTTWLSSKLHQRIIKKYHECWVPDNESGVQLTGVLGHVDGIDTKVKYIGVLSRLKPSKKRVKNDLLVVLSGPEPQRTIIEEKLLSLLINYNKKVLFVRGTFKKMKSSVQEDHITIKDYLLSHELEQEINQSSLVLCRSGYTSIMDLAVLKARAFFIPTPGQYEQEYLAKLFSEKLIVPYSSQDDFTIDKLEEVKNYTGFEGFEKDEFDLNLFKLFNGKRKF